MYLIELLSEVLDLGLDAFKSSRGLSVAMAFILLRRGTYSETGSFGISKKITAYLAFGICIALLV